MKRIRSALLAILTFTVVLVVATGCFRPAAPDVTPTPAEGVEGDTPEEPDLEATAIANSTQAAQTLEAQTAEAPPAEGEVEEEPTEEQEEPVATSTEPPASPTPAPDTATPIPTAEPTVCPPTPVPTTAPAVATPVPQTGTTTHVVQRGDNLFRIALRYGTTVQAIMNASGIANPQHIYVGQTLTIPTGGQAPQPAQPSPGGTTYVVQPGDNLFRIALRYGMHYQRLAAYNGIANPSDIYVGQVLRIPPQ